MATLQLLGGFDLRASAGQSVKVPAGKVRALFAALALAPNCRQSREFLLTLLWDNFPERQARGNLRFALNVLRKALAHTEGLSISAGRETVALDPVELQVDAIEFERLAKRNVIADLHKAVDLYRGEFLEGLTVRCEPFEDWVRAYRTKLRDQFEGALNKLLIHARDSRDEQAAIEIAQRLLTLDPLREDIHHLLISIYRQHGRKKAAIEQYNRYTEVLRSELNKQPDVETSRLIEGLRPKLAPATARSTAYPNPSPCPILVQSLRDERGKQDNELANLLDESIQFNLARLNDFKLVITPVRWRKTGCDADNNNRSTDAKFVVTGAAKRRNGQIEVTIRLTETPSLPHFWARRYLLAPDGLEELDTFVAKKIVPPIRAALQQKQLELLRQISATELDDFQLGLLARAELEKLSRASLGAAVGFARRTGKNGRNSSLACSMLALARVFQIRMGWVESRSGALAEALESVEQALSLEFNDPVAHGVLGLVHLWSGSHARALNSVSRAISLSPSRADVIHWKGLVLDFTGKHEQAIEHHLAALDLDPTHGAAFATVNALSGAFYELAAYENAAEWARRSIKVNPNYRRSHAVLAASLAQLGDERGSASALKSARIVDPSLSLKSQLSGFAYKNTSEIIAWEKGFRKAGLR